MARRRFYTEEIVSKSRQVAVRMSQWRNHYNTKRSYSSLGYRASLPQTDLTRCFWAKLCKNTTYEMGSANIRLWYLASIVPDASNIRFRGMKRT